MLDTILLVFILVGLAASAAGLLRALGRTAKLDESLREIQALAGAAEKNGERIERAVKAEIASNREEFNTSARETRQELAASVQKLAESIRGEIGQTANLQKNQLDTFSRQLASLIESNDRRLGEMRETVEKRLQLLQDENSRKLEDMRTTVGEKLDSTLNQRLGQSFKLVSERLELVQRGLGEMQTLAAGVGDLKKVLSNVKTRGIWGEVQLGMLLEQILTPEQYGTNVNTKNGSADRVEFAIKLPGRDSSNTEPVWLPIDAKFPYEDYHTLIEAQERGDADGVAAAGKALEARVKAEAKSIRDKYLDPPKTTDFAILYLPIEGLFAEVIRRPGLSEQIQREFRVTIAGPTTISALMSSLQMGFRTLAIEKRSSEIWTVLGAVKTEFGTFAEILDKTQKKLQEASNTIESASKKSRTIERKLKDVQGLPAGESVNLIGDGDESP